MDQYCSCMQFVAGAGRLVGRAKGTAGRMKQRDLEKETGSKLRRGRNGRGGQGQTGMEA